MHFVVGGMVMGITSSWIVLSIVGIGKELYDYKSYGKFSKADAIVTILGGGFAYVAKTNMGIITLFNNINKRLV
tara:strand:+ start:405 stop:626 length:222 start_codon:yes stop_codon:yes gene_type:complete